MSDPQVEPEQQEVTVQVTPPNAVPVQPVPTSVDIGVAHMGENSRAIVLTMSTPLGQQHYFFGPEGAMELAKALQRQAREIMAWDNVMNKKLIVPR